MEQSTRDESCDNVCRVLDDAGVWIEIDTQKFMVYFIKGLPSHGKERALPSLEIMDRACKHTMHLATYVILHV